MDPRRMARIPKKSKKPKKSSKRANLEIRWRQIVNGMDQAGPKSPVFVKMDGKIKKYQPDKLPEYLTCGCGVKAEVWPPQKDENTPPEWAFDAL